MSVDEKEKIKSEKWEKQKTKTKKKKKKCTHIKNPHKFFYSDFHIFLTRV